MTPDPELCGAVRPRGLAASLGRKIWIGLAATAGVTVVVLSWRVPEPETPPDPRQVENMSYLKYTPQKYTPQQAPPPNYGTR